MLPPLAAPLLLPFAAAAAPAPPATTEAADTPDDLPAAADAAAAAALAAGGGRRAGAFILGHATPARLKEIMVHESWSKALRWFAKNMPRWIEMSAAEKICIRDGD